MLVCALSWSGCIGIFCDVTILFSRLIYPPTLAHLPAPHPTLKGQTSLHCSYLHNWRAGKRLSVYIMQWPFQIARMSEEGWTKAAQQDMAGGPRSNGVWIFINKVMKAISHEPISCSEIPLKEFIAVFWRTWIVLLAPFFLSPLLFLAQVWRQRPNSVNFYPNIFSGPTDGGGAGLPLHHPTDGRLLDDGGPAPTHHLHDPHGNLLLLLLPLLHLLLLVLDAPPHPYPKDV